MPRVREKDFFMACFKCGTERSTIHLSQVIDGKTDVRDFCEACLEADFGHEAMLEMKRQAIDAAVKEYYDTATEEELAEQREWAEMVGPNILIAAPDL